jgi:hypothetical protein
MTDRHAGGRPCLLRRAPWLALGLVLVTASATACVFVTAPGPLRSLASVVVVLGPGLALAPLLGVRDGAMAVLLVALISVTSLVCVAQAVTYVAFFSWRPCAISLFGLTALGAATQTLRMIAAGRQ